MKRLATFGNKRNKPIHIDQWVPEEEDKIFKHAKGVFIAPIKEMYELSSSNISIFILSRKKGYNSEKLRNHITHYLNYFEKFYDRDKELLSVYTYIKYFIDYEPSYNKEMLFNDIKTYLLSPSLQYKIILLNRDNYIMNLTYQNQKNPSLQYTNSHCLLLMRLSFIMLTAIPLLAHFMYIKKIQNYDSFLLEIYSQFLDIFDVDLYNKLYDTSYSNKIKNKANNPLWENQDIRGINVTTSSIENVENLLLNIIPNYKYSENAINLNFVSTRKNNDYTINGIKYEFDYVQLSSSKTSSSEDANSEFDKFEVFCIKSDEALYLQNKVNYDYTMKLLEIQYGPFSQNEIEFYKKKLSSDGNDQIINSFQKQLIFALFFKYFNDPESIKALNIDDYIKLIIISKKLLLQNKLVILPYIISSKINNLSVRKSLNKKELAKVQASELYREVVNNYKNTKAADQVLSYAATIIASNFTIIDYYDKSIDGRKLKLENIPSIMIMEEMLVYALLING